MEVWTYEFLTSALDVRGILYMMGKVVPVIYLTEHHARKTYWGVEV